MTPEEQKELARLTELARQEDTKAAETEDLKRRLAAAEARLTQLTHPQKSQAQKDAEVARSAVVETGAVQDMIFKVIFGGFVLALILFVVIVVAPHDQHVGQDPPLDAQTVIGALLVVLVLAVISIVIQQKRVHLNDKK